MPAGTGHGTVQRLRGEGPPRPDGKGNADIRYRLEIEVPESLTDEQEEAVEKLAETINGTDRRARAARRRRRGERDGRPRVRRETDDASVDAERGVFMISVAAELAQMHPQTLRMYEARGLIEPQRSPKNTRLYSQRDVERLRRIQRMTTEEGLNLAGVETVLEMEERVERMRAELDRVRQRAEGARAAPGDESRLDRGERLAEQALELEQIAVGEGVDRRRRLAAACR